ncbi:hypothetical protein PR202_ga13308 [Eleusine coracana subsp. coracana]|uniref:Uncharacterized protein n=1 Tax=Eleusine coracana subsp. coracana TaxID=191504 RepID=A0AAV5CED5_ELECO|nr:hypothetical protein PR202_ga13308 [Eleusine coracana subsp. coracana]
MSRSDSSGCPPWPAAKDPNAMLDELLGHIHGYYKAALDRIPVAELPALIVSSTSSPTPSAPTTSPCASPTPPPRKGVGRRRSRRGTKRKAGGCRGTAEEG